LSQPLTTLRCSLELSVAEQQQLTVAAALEQTETVIGMIQLLREFLEAEQGIGEAPAVPLMPILQSVSSELATVAAVRGVRLRLSGTCTVKVRLGEARLRRALEYLVMAMIDRQPAGSELTLLMSERPEGTVLRGERGYGAPKRSRAETSLPGATAGDLQARRDSVGDTMRRVRLAIAARVLESAKATLSFDDGVPGFVLRIPQGAADTAD
jgi:signal transduction histidine kinase